MKEQSINQFVAGHLEKGFKYSYFLPHKVNLTWIWTDADINTLLEQAALKLGELNAFARLVPDIDLFLHLHVIKEAVITSKIEGTETNVDEALLPIEEIPFEKKDDWVEVNNYTRALNMAIKELSNIPLSSRLLRKTHSVLLQGVRGDQKMPGEFRRSQNWIGGHSLAQAAFIPPAHHYIEELMSDLENFLHSESARVPALVKIAIAHYQFETIHPFLDGNGRIGRLLITLFLVSEQILEKPLLYLSSFFEKNRVLYYDNLSRVREKNDLSTWIKYFLSGIAETAEFAVMVLSAITLLKKQREDYIKANLGRRTGSALTLLNYLFKEPVVRTKEVVKVCNLSIKAANDLLTSFVEAGILNETTGNARYRIFVFQEYLALFR